MGTPLRALIIEDSEDDTLLLVRELQRGGKDLSPPDHTVGAVAPMKVEATQFLKEVELCLNEQ